MFKNILNKIKNTNLVYDYTQMAPYIRKYWWQALVAVGITIPVGALDAVIAWALKPYMDVVMIEKSANTIWIPLMILLFSFIQGVLTYIANYANTWVGNRISSDVKIDLFAKLLTFDVVFFDTNTSGNILQRFNGDVDAACSGLLSNLKKFSTRFFSSVSLIFVLIYNSWQLAIIAIVMLFIALYPLKMVRKKIKGINQQSVFTNAELTTHYNEAFSGNRVVTSYNLFSYQAERFHKTLHNIFRLGMKMIQRTGLLSPFMHMIVSFGIAFVIWAGSYLIVTGQITSGNFVSFLAALILLYNPIKSIGNSFNNVQISLLAIERVFELMKAEPKIKDKKNATKIGKIKTIEYKNVDFEYVENKPVLQNINLKAKNGEKIAFVGNSGGGKTTLVNLLNRFYDVKNGGIYINGTDIRDIKLKSLRDKIAVVFQDNFLFSGTIRDNIMLGNKNATEEELQKAVEGACLSSVIKEMPEGLDTQVGERGSLLSGGQKQRVAIARAFLKNAPIVVLDEATSALDNKSEAVVQKAIDNLMADRTVFVIAHRLSTVKNADKIVVVNYGKIAEIGTHQELIENPNSIYHSLYQAQLQ